MMFENDRHTVLPLCWSLATSRQQWDLILSALLSENNLSDIMLVVAHPQPERKIEK
jgi:hypothetical protein